MSRGRHPQSHPTFTTEQPEEARQIARAHHAPYVPAQRAKMMIHLAKHPQVSNRELAERIGAHRNRVSKWRGRWADGDPRFVEKANPILDLYQGLFQDRSLRAREYALCFDQKTSIQARARMHDSLPPSPQHPQLVEHEYERQRALNLLAVWDVHRAQAFGRCYAQRGRAEVEAFLDEALARPPYDSARTNHLILDNRSSQHPSTFPSWVAQHHRRV